MTEYGQTGEWVSAAQRGDSLALAKLLAVHHPRLRARAESRMDAALKARTGPDDILQEVYLQVFQRIANFDARDPGAFVNWVLTILDRKLIDARRAAHRAVRDVAREVPAGAATDDSYFNLLDHVYADTGTPSRALRRREAVDALPTCIDELSDPQRQVIELRFLQNTPLAEVAQKLGKTEGAIVALSQRALAALRAGMDRRGEFSWHP